MLLKKSLIIAEKMGDAMSRLTKESISKNQEKLTQLNNELYGKFNFKPEINKISEKLVQKKRRERSNEKLGLSNKPRWEELYSMVNYILFYLKFYLKKV